MKNYHHQFSIGIHTDEDIAEKLRHQNARCIYCATDIRRYFERDHIVPVSLGGTNDADNIQLTCMRCNRKKRNYSHEWMLNISADWRECADGNKARFTTLKPLGRKKSKKAYPPVSKVDKQKDKRISFFFPGEDWQSPYIEDGDQYRRVYMPYCIKLLPGKLWIVLNRRYKPLGFSKNSWVNYMHHAHRATLTKSQLQGMSVFELTDGEGYETFYLYDDNCIPTESPAAMQAYLKKMSVLMFSEWDIL